jgi:hypothetical protein
MPDGCKKVEHEKAGFPHLGFDASRKPVAVFADLSKRKL